MPSNTTPIQERVTFAQDVAPSKESKEVIWIDTSNDPPIPKTWTGSQWVPIPRTDQQIREVVDQGPNPYNSARTFSESDLTVSQTRTAISNEAVELADTITDTQYSPTVERVIDNFDEAGLEFTVDNSIEGLQFTFGSDNGSAANVTLRNETDSNNLNTWNLSPGDSIRYEQPLTVGDTFSIRHNQSNYFTPEAFTPATNYADITMLNGVYSTGTSNDRFWAITQISPIKSNNSGSVNLQWAYPNDLYQWDTATFTRDLDGETVDVFVEYSDDGGSTWSRANGGNPISRAYQLDSDSAISVTSNVRLSVELSRTDTSNNPSLKSAYRSYLFMYR